MRGGYGQDARGKGTYVEITGPLGSHAVQERTKGFHSILDKQAGWKMIAQQSGEFKRDKALAVMEDILQSRPEKIDALYTHFDEMALGAIQAINASKRDIKVFSANAREQGIFESNNGWGSAQVAVPYPFFRKRRDRNSCEAGKQAKKCLGNNRAAAHARSPKG